MTISVKRLLSFELHNFLFIVFNFIHENIKNEIIVHYFIVMKCNTTS